MNSQNPNRRNILIGLSVFVVILLISLIAVGTYYFRLSNGELNVDDGGVAVLPTQPPTATPFPTLTPTPTSTPLPTETPLPTPTATPQPMSFSVTGPKFIPAGLPLQVEWVIEAIGGDGVATVILDDLGGAMLTGDEAGNVIIARSLTHAFSENPVVGYDQEFVVTAIIDPNIKSGVVSLEIRNSFFAEPILIPWLTTDDSDLTNQTFEIVLDGVEDEIQAAEVVPIDNEQTAEGNGASETSGEDTAELDDPVNSGFQAFRSREGVELEFPAEWFITESQDGIIDISVDPVNPEQIQLPGEVIFANIFTGSAEDFGLVSDEALSPEAVKELLLGVTIPTGDGEDEILVTETGLEVLEESSVSLTEGHSGLVTHLRTPAAFAEAGEIPFESVFAVVVQGEKIIVMNGYTPLDESEGIEAIKLIASSLRFIERETEAANQEDEP